MIYYNKQSMGEISIIQSLVYFHFFEAPNDAFEVQFSWLHFDTISKTLIQVA